MKRDWNLLRAIMESIEQDNFSEFLERRGYSMDTTNFTYMESEEYSEKHQKELEQIIGHIELLLDANLIRGIEIQKYQLVDEISGFFTFRPRLTMEGFDLLDAMRNKELWTKLKNTLKKAGLDLSVTSWKEVSKYLIRSSLDSFNH